MNEVRVHTAAMRTPLRKSVLLGNLSKQVDGNESDATPLRRGSHTFATPQSGFETSKDDSERSDRRMRKQMSAQTSATPPGQSPLSATPKFNGEKEIRDHFQICTKLHAENKINTKNVWTLQIIDMVRLMAKKTSSDTLRMAGTSLDISAKVYSVRVDHIHADGLKLASSLARVSNKDNQNNDDNFEDNDDEGPAGGEKSKNKRGTKRKTVRKTGPKLTIAKDPKTLIEKPKKLESVFFSTRINSELSTIENLVTNRLPMNTSGYKFITLSPERFWATGNEKPDLELETEIDIDLESLPTEGKMCAPFIDFHLDKWNPDEEEQQLNIDKSILDVQPNDEVILDENGLPIHELDGSIANIFDENHADLDNLADDEVEEHEEVNAQFHRDIAQVVDLRPDNDDRIASEYSYNSVISTHNGQVVDQIWAGPSYWKLKFLRRNTSKFSGGVNVAQSTIRQKKKKIEDTFVDFEKELEDVDKIPRLKARKKNTASNNNNNYSLPLPDQFVVDMYKTRKQFMTKPGTILVSKEELQKETECEVPILTEIENIPPIQDSDLPPEENDIIEGQDLGPDDLGCADNTDLNEEEIAVAAQHNFLAENLVDVPTDLIQKTYIPFALQPKKMDMKKLKAAIWKCVTEKNETAKVKVIPFSKMYAELSQTLPSVMQKELSCPLAFVALLHLCNEQNLQLDQHPNYQDFTIRKY